MSQCFDFPLCLGSDVTGALCVLLSITTSSLLSSLFQEIHSLAFQPGFVTSFRTLLPSSWRHPSSAYPTGSFPTCYLAFPTLTASPDANSSGHLHILLHPQFFFQLSSLGFSLSLGMGAELTRPSLRPAHSSSPGFAYFAAGPSAVSQTTALDQVSVFRVPCAHRGAHRYLTFRPPLPADVHGQPGVFPKDASLPRTISLTSWLACQLLIGW